MNQLIESLRRFSKVIVTGPQRSGTTIAMEILAHELGYHQVREEEIHVDDISRLSRLLASDSNYVLQAPGLCSVVHLLRGEDTAIVLMRRTITDIITSQQKIEWGINELWELRKYFKEEGCISEIKYHYWDNFQKPLLQSRGFELEYGAMEEHSLFIRDRNNFTSRQTKLSQ